MTYAGTVTDNQTDPVGTDAPVNRPNIFVVGTMKGGTTALHRILTEHPEIHSGTQKEIHYFSLRHDRGEDWYHDHFRKLPAGQNYVDASPTYFDAANTHLLPRMINAYNPDSRVVMIARNPVERAISHFHHLRKVNKMAALADMTADQFFSLPLDSALPGIGPHASNFMLVINFSMYFQKARRYEDVFGDRMLVLDNIHLRENSEEAVQRVFEHVGVEPIWNDSFTEIRHSNATALNDISPETFNKLSRIFRNDYLAFCNRYGVEFRWPTLDA